MPGYGQSRVWDPTPRRSFLLQELIATPLGVAHARRLLDTTGLFNEEAGPSSHSDGWAVARFSFARPCRRRSGSIP